MCPPGPPGLVGSRSAAVAAGAQRRPVLSPFLLFGFRVMGADAHKARITDCCVSSDCKLLATVSLDGCLKVLALVCLLLPHGARVLYPFQISGGGHRRAVKVLLLFSNRLKTRFCLEECACSSSSLVMGRGSFLKWRSSYIWQGGEQRCKFTPAHSLAQGL